MAEHDVRQTINAFKNRDLKQSVALFRSTMPPPVTDKAFRESVIRALPLEFSKLRIDDPQLIAEVRSLIDPVLSLYGRSQAYDIIIIRYDTPIMMSDSGVLLVISTGMIERAESDDELLGHAAHEVGHEYLIKYSVAAKYLLRTITAGRNERELKMKTSEILALIELQCDAFAALTLASIGRNPLEFIKSFERMSRDFPNEAVEYHPSDETRRKVVTDILPGKTLASPPRESAALLNIKQMVAPYSNEK